MKPSKIRPKRHRTRKSKAIRRTVLFILLLYCMTTSHAVTFFPSNAMRYLEESDALPRTITVVTLPAPELRFGQVRLNACDEALLMGGIRLDLNGWSGSGGTVVDCTKPASVQAGIYSYRTRDRDDMPQIFVFGRVEDENVERVRVTMHVPDTPLLDQSRTMDWDSCPTDRVVQSGVNYAICKGGKRYFVMTQWPQSRAVYQITYQVNGETIQQDIVDSRCTFFG